jgi:tetratricopeptide (TPR) repeat protein
MDAEPPFDMSVGFDESLREVPNDPAAMSAAVGWLQRRLDDPALTDAVRVRTLGTMGSCARVLGRLDDAQAALDEAVERARAIGDERLIIANEIRRAHVSQYRGDFDDSNRRFAEILERCGEDGPLVDFAHQHTGKNLFEQQRYSEAIVHFQKALEIRQALGATDLISNSEQALSAATARRAAALESAPGSEG